MAGLKVKFLVPVRYGVGDEIKNFEVGDVYEFPITEKEGVKDLLDSNYVEKASGSEKSEPEVKTPEVETK